MKRRTPLITLLATSILSISCQAMRFELVDNILEPTPGIYRGHFRILQDDRQVGMETLTIQNARYTGFAQYSLAELGTINPLSPLPEDLGYSCRILEGTVRYPVNNFPFNNYPVTLEDRRTEYPHTGTWSFTENRDTHETTSHLSLKIQLRGNAPTEVHRLNRPLPHILVHSNPQGGEIYYYDGVSCYAGSSIRQTWRNPQNSQEYPATIFERNADLPNHTEAQIVFVHPFEDNNRNQRANYEGRYTHNVDLNLEAPPYNFPTDNIIYSAGSDPEPRLFIPTITCERWDSFTLNRSVNFLIASYHPSAEVSCNNRALMPGGITSLPVGFYRKGIVTPIGRGRVEEQWHALDLNTRRQGQTYRIILPTGESYINKTFLGDNDTPPQYIRLMSQTKFVTDLQLKSSFDNQTNINLLQAGLRRWDRLTNVQLNTINRDALRNILNTMSTSVKKVDLSGSISIEPQDERSLTRLNTLTHLNLQRPSTRDENFRAYTTEEIRALSAFRSLTSLNISHCGVNDDGMLSLVTLINLKHLEVATNYITDRGAQVFSSLVNLTHLNLHDNRLTDNGLQYLSGLMSLTYLHLTHGNQFTGRGMHYLSPLINLETLFLISPVGLQGCREIAHLTNLRSLSITDGNINADVVRELAPLTKLTRLTLAGNRVGPEGAGIIAGAFPSLTSLNLRYQATRGNPIGNAGVRALSTLRSLTDLDLYDNRVTLSENEIRGLFPNLVELGL